MSSVERKGTVLFTGNNEKMIDNMVELIGLKYETIKCAPLESDLRQAIRSLVPHVLVICLMDEIRVIHHVYDSLQDDSKYLGIPVVLIGSEDDSFQFQNRIKVKHLEVFNRPLEREKFQKKLDEFVQISNEGIHKIAIEDELKETIHEEPTREEETHMYASLDEKKSVLVVDDDVRMLNTIKLYLQDLYDVTVVPSGKLALKFISKRHVDLVLLDCLMPEMSGLEVLKEIRENSQRPDVPVIFLTGVSEKSEVMRGLELRPNGYLLKPVTREVLLERVVEAILGL